MNNFINCWPTLKRLMEYAKPFKKLLFLGIFLLLSAALSEVLGPILISNFIKITLEKHQCSKKIIILNIICFIILQVTSVILYYSQNIIFSKISIKIIQNLRYDIMKSTLMLPINIYDSQPIGHIISKITNDTESIRELYDTILGSIVNSSVLVLIVLIAMFILSWKMALIAIILIPIVLFIIMSYQKYSIPILKNIRHYLSKIYHEFNEIVNGITVIQQFQREKQFRKKIINTSYMHYKYKMQALKLEGFLLRPLLNFLSSMILCGIMFLCIVSHKQTFKVGVLYAFISYLSRLNEPLISVASQQPLLQKAIVSGERIFELMDIPKQKYGSKYKDIKKGKINIKNLFFKHKKNKNYTLKNINIDIQPNKFIAFIGKTGSGKSTLANLLMGYYQAEKGSIYLNNQKMEKIKHSALRSSIALIQQNPIILPINVLKNITLGKKIELKEVYKILDLVHLTPLISSLPKGIYTNLSEQGNNLSVGQKQLISIARALIRNPKILILDEATANIDSKTEKWIQKSILKIKKKTTLVMIAHRLSTVIKADKIILLDKGKIIEQGNHKKLMNIKNKYYKMYKSQLLNKN
ncbi:MAG: SmdB family multidrug efflux ABC transporter permease/ATP-binding protein [Buchnera aphidicola (Periphyllus lyropictus)]|uniref:SmdB family multidrug efflux ABC transporter permease/ATP-binding protein n=1 Tax=Buchnera aphidicola TaxID=9 RepID=UPI001EBF2458|nr:SmdB family multidrug efflux ABC transporter permease/ATP-binding protein [Buchnera aphidicola]NIH16511.1 SmdB family multidrug efflux ABC transporter permease/ATP-binding protein [Buchnera aphidicola (Periphyllus lyropictus)]USS94795.1 SmdB family multidrug efflux ABC transporter permease/ATP-binding protein [Buchnera aphidicola (Periphyllus lyropictus)]